MVIIVLVIGDVSDMGCLFQCKGLCLLWNGDDCGTFPNKLFVLSAVLHMFMRYVKGKWP